MEKQKLLKSLKRRLSGMLCLMALLAIGQSALATDYYLRGDFNGWGATKLTKDADGWYKSGFYGVNYNETKRFKITETTDWTGTEHWEWESSPNKGKDGCTTGKQTSGDTGITIKNTNNNGYIQIWYSDQSGKCAYMYTKYSLAGNTLFGSDWAADNTSAVLSWDGTYYTKTYGSQNSGTNIEFKVIRGRSWDDASFGYSQYKSSSPTNLNGCGSVSNNSGNVKLSLSKKVKSITFKWTAESSIYIILEPDCTPPSITSQPSTTDATYCKDASATELSVTASGTATLSYQWKQCSTSGGTYTDISGATSSSYTPSTATAGKTYYKCYVSNSCGSDTSDASGAITVKAKPNAFAVSGTATICTGNNTNVTLAGSQTGYTYKLYKNSSATSTTTAGTGSALNFSVSEAGTYTVKGYVTGIETCSTDMTNSASVTSIGATITNVTPAEAHPYEIVTLTASKSATWSITGKPSGVADDEYYPVSGNTGTTFSFKGAKGTSGNYTVRASADNCNTDTTISIVNDPNKCN